MLDRNFYSVKQASSLLGIRTHGVLTLIRSGQLPAIDVSLTPGGKPRWRILPDDFDAFIEKRTHQPKTPTKRKRKSKATSNVKKYF